MKSDVKLAAKWGCDARTIRRWRVAGAPLTDAAAMRHWLACRKHLPAGTARLLTEQRAKRTAKVLSSDLSRPVNGNGTGAAEALRRLESFELRAFSVLETAMSGGDALEIRSARESWLRVGDALRRYDLAVETTRRATELVAGSGVERAIRIFAVGLRAAFGGFENVAPHVVGLTTAEDVWTVLKSPGREFLPAAVASLQAYEVPEWLVKAFAEGVEVFPGDGEHAKALAEVIRQTVAAYGVQARELFDARVQAEKRWHDASDPAERAQIWHEQLAPLLRGETPDTPSATEAV